MADSGFRGFPMGIVAVLLQDRVTGEAFLFFFCLPTADRTSHRFLSEASKVRDGNTISFSRVFMWKPQTRPVQPLSHKKTPTSNGPKTLDQTQANSVQPLVNLHL